MANDWGEAWYALGATYEAAGDTANAEKRPTANWPKSSPRTPAPCSPWLHSLSIRTKDDASEVIAKIRALNPPQPVLDAVKALEDKIAGVKPAETK